MCKRTVKLWHLKSDGPKLFAGTIEAGSPAELVLNWSASIAASGNGVSFATYEGSFVESEAAIESEVGVLAAHPASLRLLTTRQQTWPSMETPAPRHSIEGSDYAAF